MREANAMFSCQLTEVENRLSLYDNELALIESRFFTGEEAGRLSPTGMRLF